MLDQLSNYLNEDKAGHYRYLLVDPLKPVKDEEPLALVNIKEIFPESEVLPVLRSDLFYDPDYCPHLVLLAKPNEDVETDMLSLTLVRSKREQILYKHYICAWISSELTIDVLAEKLVEFGNKMGEDMKPNQHYFFPFFEHIRMQLLRESLVLNSASIFEFDFAKRYVYMNYYGELENIISNQNNVSDNFSSIKQTFLQKSLQYQHEPKLVYGLVQIWQKHVPSLPINALWISAEQIVNAQKIGLTSYEDILTYSFYSLLAGKDVMVYDDIAEAVNLAIKQPDSLSDSFNSFSQKIWNEIGINTVTEEDN